MVVGLAVIEAPAADERDVEEEEKLGVVLGNEIGVKLGSVRLGNEIGVKLGIVMLGIEIGVKLGIEIGVKLGIEMLEKDIDV